MNFRMAMRAAAIGIICAASLSSTALAKTQLKALAAWPATLPQVKGIYYKFEENVTKASNGEITFQNLGPETVGPFDQFQPVSAGAFDLDYAADAYYQAQTGVALAMVLLGDMEKVRSTGVFDYINDYFGKKFGIEVLAAIPSASTQFVLLNPLKNDRLDGRKIRSNALYDAVVRQLGAAPVSMAPADAYAAMEKGTLDGVAWPMHATADFKLYEVGKYMTSPGFGKSGDMIIMNKAKLDSLPADQQKIIRDEAHNIEIEGAKFYDDLAKSQFQTMLDKGVKVSEFTPEAAKMLEQTYSKDALEVARKSHPDDVNAFVSFARSKGVFK